MVRVTYPDADEPIEDADRAIEVFDEMVEAADKQDPRMGKIATTLTLTQGAFPGVRRYVSTLDAITSHRWWFVPTNGNDPWVVRYRIIYDPQTATADDWDAVVPAFESANADYEHADPTTVPRGKDAMRENWGFRNMSRMPRALKDDDTDADDDGDVDAQARPVESLMTNSNDNDNDDADADDADDADGDGDDAWIERMATDENGDPRWWKCEACDRTVMGYEVKYHGDHVRQLTEIDP